MASRRFLAKSPNSEHAQQAAFFSLISRVNHPASFLTAAVPNQALALLTAPARIHFSREGCKPGIPDVMCLYPSPTGGCLFIEFKKPGLKPRSTQLLWLTALARAGHTCLVCDDAEAAFEQWLKHVGIKVTF